MKKQNTEQTVNDEVFVPQSWLLLRQQVLHLAQFGGSVQVLYGAKGAGKTTFLTQLCEASSSLEFICLSADAKGSVQDLFNQLADALGLLLPTRSSVGQQIAAMRSFAQALEKEQERAVVAIDNAERLDESALAALVSVLQGHSDSGFGLHFIFFSEPGLPERIDQLHLLDVTVHDALLPAFSHQDVAKLLEVRLALVNLPAIDIKNTWRLSEGLPGRVLENACNFKRAEEKVEVLKSLKALPFAHGIALAILVFVLVWALLVRDDEQESVRSAPIANSDLNSFESYSSAKDELLESASSVGEKVLESNSSTVVASSITLPKTDNSKNSALAVKNDPLPNKEEDVGSKVVNSSEDGAADGELDPPASAVLNDRNIEVSSESDEIAVGGRIEDEQAVSLDNKSSSMANKVAAQVTRPKHVGKPNDWLSSSHEYMNRLPDRGYMLQIMALSDFESLQRFAEQQKNFENLYTYKTLRNGKVLFVLMEGFYADKDSAVSAVKNLPNSQQRGGPWPKSVETIKRERTLH